MDKVKSYKSITRGHNTNTTVILKLKSLLLQLKLIKKIKGEKEKKMETILKLASMLEKFGPDAFSVVNAALKTWKDIPETDKVAVENAAKAFIAKVEGK